MNLAQSGYHMLMILSVVDGQYAVPEGKIIVDYLARNYQEDIDIDRENEALLDVTKEQIPEHFKEAAGHFLEISTEEQRIDFLAFAYRLVQADGHMASEENKILSSLAHFWNIDIKPLLEEEEQAAEDKNNTAGQN
ncbi:MAG: TerB family tellurite resistance protein [Bacteroidota bacterium]|nr:TerB family tellurite resistance protein [Bacteroidota bacterium]